MYITAISLTICLAMTISVWAGEYGTERPFVFGMNMVSDGASVFGSSQYQEDVYRRLQEVGGTAVRLTGSPRDIEPLQGRRDWDQYNQDIVRARSYGMEPMICIVNVPGWANITGKPTHLYGYREELLPEFEEFCRNLAEQNRGAIKFYQLWNEPNGCSWHFHDGFNHYEEYVPMLVAAWRGLKAGDPDCQLLLGSLDDAGGNAPIFLKGIYEVLTRDYPGERFFDGITDHPYSHAIDSTPLFRVPVAEANPVRIAAPTQTWEQLMHEHGQDLSSTGVEVDHADAQGDPLWFRVKGFIDGAYHHFYVEAASDEYVVYSTSMKKKLDTLHHIMRAHGDGDLPIWITEYGWHTGDLDETAQARLQLEALEAFQRPEWDYLQGVIHLCIGDFEGQPGEGFGLVDANLRPRESFYAFQGAPRYGYYPPARIRCQPMAGDTMRIAWETQAPTQGSVRFWGDSEVAPEGAPVAPIKATETGENKYEVILSHLESGRNYHYEILTATQTPVWMKPVTYSFRTPDQQVWNGDFEEGFFGMIGLGWQAGGRGFLTDAATLPLVEPAAGEHAQAVFLPAKHAPLDTTLWTQVATEPGNKLHLSAHCAGRFDTASRIEARVAINPAGDVSGATDSAIWSEWKTIPARYVPVTVDAVATGKIATVLVQVRSAGTPVDADPVCVIDNVQIDQQRP